MVSFIIPAHNEQSLIGGTIDAITAAMRGREEPHEIIVAADGCDDATAAISAAKGAAVVAHDRRQIAATRNLGARHARGDLLIFVDGDTRVTATCIEQAIDAIRRGAVAGGATFRLDGPVPLYARVLLPLMRAFMRLSRQAGGAFLFCTRAAFHTAGGWDETYFAGEEIHFVRALKRVGRFVMIAAPVITSGRKARTYSLGEMLALLVRGVLSPSMTKDRSKLDFFYAPRRPDPHDRTDEPSRP